MGWAWSFNRWPISYPDPTFLFGQLTKRKADPGDKISMFPKHLTCAIASRVKSARVCTMSKITSKCVTQLFMWNLTNHLTYGFHIITPGCSKLCMSDNGILVRFKRAEQIKNGLHEVLRLLRESSSKLQAIIFFNCFWSQAKPVNSRWLLSFILPISIAFNPDPVEYNPRPRI